MSGFAHTIIILVTPRDFKVPLSINDDGKFQFLFFANLLGSGMIN